MPADGDSDSKTGNHLRGHSGAGAETYGGRELCYRVDAMSNTVGIRELRQQASAVLKRVVAGEVIDVTDHGHPIARIVPIRPGVLAQLVLEGRATDGEGDLLDRMEELALPAAATPGRKSPSRVLAEMRADER